MKKNIELAKKLPFVSSYKGFITKAPLKCKTVERNLGPTFYPRIASIYNNLIQALISHKTDYVKRVSTPELAAELASRKLSLQKQGLKVKVNKPIEKLFKFKNYFLPEDVYRNDNLYISVACRVYFGGEFNNLQPLQNQKERKTIRFGVNRFLVWNTAKSLSQNWSNIYNNQVFVFKVKVQSNYYIKVYDSYQGSNYGSGDIQTQFDENEVQNLITSQLTLLSNSEKFDWVLTDINGIMAQNK